MTLGQKELTSSEKKKKIQSQIRKCGRDILEQEKIYDALRKKLFMALDPGFCQREIEKTRKAIRDLGNEKERLERVLRGEL